MVNYTKIGFWASCIGAIAFEISFILSLSVFPHIYNVTVWQNMWMNVVAMGFASIMIATSYKELNWGARLLKPSSL